MALEGVIISFLQAYTPLLSFVAGLVLGDALIVLAALAGAGKMNIFTIYIFGVLGELVHDSVFYYFSKSKIIYYLKRKLKLNKGKNAAAELIEKLSGERTGYFLPMFLAKFIYGVRDSVMLYIGHKEKSFKRYIETSLLASMCTLAVVIGLGWLAGRGFTQIISVFTMVEKGLGYFILSILIVYIVYRLIGKIIIKSLRRHFRKVGINI